MNRHTTPSSAWLRFCGALALVAAVALPASAQNVTTSEIQRLQDQVYQAGTDVSRLRSTNPEMAARLQGELDDLREEVVYLKVRMRREGNVSRNDFTDVRDRIQEVRSRAGIDTRSDATRGDNSRIDGNNRGDNNRDNQGWRTNSDRGQGSSGVSGGVSGGVAGGVPGGVSGDDRTAARGTGSRTRTQGDDRAYPDQNSTRGAGSSVIPSGQELDVRLENELSSANAQVEQRFEATTVADLYRGSEVLIPAGSTVRGVISSVTKTTRMERKGSLTVAFDQITIRGRAYPMRGTVTEALESEGIKGEAGKIGAGAGVGAIIGGIIGGMKGALLGVLIGGGGTVAATEGKDVTLPSGTILRVRLDTPPAVR